MRQAVKAAPTVRRPDVFIVGAPKCGTTALNAYLRVHPQVFIAPRKEAHYFGTDLQARYFVRDTQRYLEMFAGARGHTRVGEASAWYLYSSRAAAEIKSFSPDAYIIAMLRNPVDMMYALHADQLYVGREEIDDFEAALAAEEDRKQGRRVPRRADPVQTLFYRDTARYTDQVRRYLDAFGRERVHVVIFDEFVRETARVYRQICRFLEVDESFQPDFSPVNTSRRFRSATVRDFLLAPPAWWLWLRRHDGLLPVLQSSKALLRHLNTVRVPRPPMAPEVRRRLREEFAPEVERLSALLGRDLTPWSRQ